MISVILLEPQKAGNVGAIARAMKNFGLKELLLISPKCDPKSKEAFDRASHAEDILKKAKIIPYAQLKEFDYVIGTTAVLGTDYNIPRLPLDPEQLGKRLAGMKGKIALVFGREDHGLSNKEINDCDFIVTIPASRTYTTLNVAHAAAIVFYEIFKHSEGKKSNSHIVFGSAKEKEVTLDYVHQILDKIEFSTPEQKATQKIVWKRLLGKAMLTRREAFAVIGFFRKVLRGK